MEDHDQTHLNIRFERDGAIGSIIIDRPERRGAMTLAMWQALPGLLDTAALEQGLKVLIVRAANDDGFSAGADIGEMIANQENKAWQAANQIAINQAQYRLARFPLPTLAFIAGDCIGGGCALALACDIRIATPDARFGITPAKLGLVYPFHDIKLLTDLVGPGQAKRLLFTGEFICADEARDIGLVELIASTPVALQSAIAQVSARSNTVMKKMIRRILDGQPSDDKETLQMFASAFASTDFAEGTAAFAERRQPQFEADI